MRRPLYLIQEAFTSLRVNRTSVTIGIITTAFTISCFGVFVLLYDNLKHLAGTLQHDIEVVLPAPLGPVSNILSPFSIRTVTSCSAVHRSKNFETWNN